ncbi:hypothetical protein [Methylobacter sp.]|uniref:helix-turn-helix domain-containing protein n=1 Tax=Methylobacter sp. TaxID=2051955 RepID=UPI0024889158|nr:hypothetical protein [Methylobacter sp.]MDI1277290.1 hypothetical protein [Methylobacter sp.]MDI1357856.1 hypothetical protein [Methylobacter sp.]
MIASSEEQNPLAQPVDKIEVAVLKTISSRLKEARALTSLAQHEAAQLLSIPTNQLEAWELGINISPIPFRVIEDASKLYDISIDWLFGLTEDWELCPEIRKERNFAAHLQKLFAEVQAKTIAEQIQKDCQIAALSGAVTALSPAIRAIYDAILKLWELNPEFDEMKGGALVIHTLDKADKTAHEATCQMVRHGLLPVEMLQNYPIKEPKLKNGASRG